MASHGVPRQPDAGPKSEKARQKELLEIKEYKDLVDQVTDRINKKEFTEDTLGLTSKLLTKNPEYYTIWNHRRRTLAHLMAQMTSEVNGTESSQRYAQNLLSSDLEFLLPLLKKFPKCYWIWNHRLWLLQQTSAHLPKQDAHQFWQHELALVAEMLRRDSRNYHGWGYRRRVISALRTFEEPTPTPETPDDTANPHATPAEPAEPTLTEREFAYTTKMVRANLSNFSAWHNRSKLLPRLLAERGADATARRHLFDTELAFAADALSMDPNDTSLWFYHQFLMASLAPGGGGGGGEACFGAFSPRDRAACLRAQIELFREVLDDWPDCKLIYQNLLGFAELYAAAAGGGAEDEHEEEDEDGGPPPPASADDMRAWLARLQELDPLRAGRWRDLERRLNL